MKLRPLKRKEAGEILNSIQSEYGCNMSSMLDTYVFFMSEKNKVYIINEDMKEADLSSVRVNSMGLYFCELNHGNVRLSMEGSFIVGKEATKNVLVVDDVIAKHWLLGQDIPCETAFEGFVIIKHNDDFLGCGKYKEGMIFNYVPKQRRVNE